MINILFQGDSITDAGRSRTVSVPNVGLGNGYPTMVAGMLSAKRNDLNFYNRGAGGNRISDIYGRWLEDAVNMEFDVISILTGINDVGFQLRLGSSICAKMIAAKIIAAPRSSLLLMASRSMRAPKRAAKIASVLIRSAAVVESAYLCPTI